MSTIEENAVLIYTMQQLKYFGSWCGETHIQKTIYLCQQLTDIDEFFKFVLYKHGPYSFELSETVQNLIGDEIVEIQTRAPYGPSLTIAEDVNQENMIKSVNEMTRKMIRTICKTLGNRGVAELERISTAVYINNKNGSSRPLPERVQELRQLKPHIKEEAAKQAFIEAERIISFSI